MIAVRKLSRKLFSILVSILLASSISLSDREYTNTGGDGRCNGSVIGTVVYGDGEVVRVELNGRDPVSSAVVTRLNFANFASFTGQEAYAGEDGITVKDDGHYILLFPGGYTGQKVVHVFNYSTNSTSAINVHCRPISLAYRPGYERAIVGHCTLNITARRVPYFKLSVSNGKWTDVSQDGRFYSSQLDTINLTNPVILQYEDNYDASATKLYFANANTMHEIDLGYPDTYTYPPLPNGNQIHHLVPAVNSSFSGLRVVFSKGNVAGYYHQYFCSELGFVDTMYHTDYVAFNSHNLSYLVTFANHKTLRIIKRDKTSKQFSLNTTLDDPIQCQNMPVRLNSHYLICLAGGGLHPVIINITEQVTSNIIPVFDSKIVRVGVLTGDTFYLSTEGSEMLLYAVNSVVVYLGRYALRAGIKYVVTSAASDIICSNAADDVNSTGSGLLLSVIIAMIIFGIVIVVLLLMLVLLPLLVPTVCTAKDRYSPLSSYERQTTSDDQVDENAETSDEDATPNLPSHLPVSYDNNLPSHSAESYDNNSQLTGADSLGAGPNDQRTIFASVSTLAEPQEVVHAADPEIVIAPIRHPYVMMQLDGSGERCDTKRKNYERDSNQPEQFVETNPAIKPVQCTQEDLSKPLPPPDTERDILKQ